MAHSATPLAATSIAQTMARKLDPTVSPQFRNGLDFVALALNSAMENVGFKLRKLGDDVRIDESQSQLPPSWNTHSTHDFRYTHTQSAMEYQLNVARLGPKITVNALAVGDDKTASFDIRASEFLDESVFPATVLKPLADFEGADDAEKERKSEEAAILRITETLFKTAGRLADLTALFRIQIVQKVARNLNKAGYEETSASTEGSTSQTDRQQGRERREPPIRPESPPQHPPGANPLMTDDGPPVARPHRGPTADFPPPDFEDEHRMLPQNRPGGHDPLAGYRPPNIGERDLYPPGLGPHDPLRPAFGPGGGMGGGMHPTFDDPLFDGRRGGAGNMGGQGGFGPQAPPGARWDPVGPGMGMGGPRGPRGPGGGNGGGPGGFGGPPGFGGGGNPFGGFSDGDFI